MPAEKISRKLSKSKKRGNKTFQVIDWKEKVKEKNTEKYFTLATEKLVEGHNVILEESPFENTEKSETTGLFHVDETNEFLDRISNITISVVGSDSLRSTNLPNVLFTNFLSDDATFKRDEVQDILNICGKNVPLSKLPIDLDSKSNLINDQTDSVKLDRFSEVSDWYEDSCGKFSKPYHLIDKYRYDNAEGKPSSGQRIIGYYDDYNKTFYVYFLDPHHLLATSVGNTREYQKRELYNLNINQIIGN